MKRAADDKAERVLSIYSRLRQGQVIDKGMESDRYGVAPRTIQRDISDIQCFLQTQSFDTGEVHEVVFDRSAGGYRLETKLKKYLEPKEILAICKVLLESRALVKEEMYPIINKLINTCTDEEEKKRLKEHIGNIIWFGGEPLMNTQIMDTLSNKLNEEKINFFSFIITNGSLLTEDYIIDKLSFWNVKDIQITLDGTKEEYESRKRYIESLKGEFYNLLNNIRMVARKGVFVNIRLNIDKENKDNIIELLKELDGIYAAYENIVFYPAFITGCHDQMDEEEKVQYVKEMLLTIKNIKKLSVNTKLYFLQRMHACINGDPWSFAIDVYGNVFACEHYVGKKEKKIGNIITMDFEQDDRGCEIHFREECENCIFLPKCYGGCESNAIDGDSPCMIDKYLIKAYLEIL